MHIFNLNFEIFVKQKIPKKNFFPLNFSTFYFRTYYQTFIVILLTYMLLFISLLRFNQDIIILNLSKIIENF